MCENFEKIKMGLFSDKKIENIIVSQNANGEQSTTNATVSVPIWELIVIAGIISAIVFGCCYCLAKKANKVFEHKIKKQARSAQILD
jgi:hypothetical protein